MAVPVVATYSTQAKIDAHTALLALVDSGTAGSVKLRSSADALLCTIPLTDPAGSVNGSTGQLTLTQAATVNATATGNVAYAELCDSAGTVHLALPAQQGTAPVSGKFVMNTLAVVSGGPVDLLSMVIG